MDIFVLIIDAFRDETVSLSDEVKTAMQQGRGSSSVTTDEEDIDDVLRYRVKGGFAIVLSRATPTLSAHSASSHLSSRIRCAASGRL